MIERVKNLAAFGVIAGALVWGLAWLSAPRERPLPQALGMLETPASAQAPAKRDWSKQPRGRKNPSPAVLKERHERAYKRHDSRMKRLPRATPATFDCVALGWVPPIRDQGQCGSCWDFSGSGVVTCAYIKQGWAKNDGSFNISEQYSLGCWQNGGCNGDDNVDVLTQAKQAGLAADNGSILNGASILGYGPYTAADGQCNLPSGAPLLKIADWGYCTPSQQSGVASVQDIKNALVQYGPIGVGIDASVLGDGTGIISGSGHSIDHDVIVVGWDDTKGQGGCWKMRNSWGTSWGNGGYCWIQYGSGDIGTEACWALAPPPPSPPPGPTPPPVPPVPPTPPVPPGPGPAPTNISVALYQDQVDSILGQSGAVRITKDTKVSDLIQYITDAMKREGKSLVPSKPCCATPALTAEPIPSALYDRLNRIEMHQREHSAAMEKLTKNLDITATAVLKLQEQALKKE